MHVFNLCLLFSLLKFLGRCCHLLLSHYKCKITREAERPIISLNQNLLGNSVPSELGISDSLPEVALLFCSARLEVSPSLAVLVLPFQRLREREQRQGWGTVPRAGSSTLTQLARG